jgi:hypothetical protein
VYVKITYTAPKVASTSTYPARSTQTPEMRVLEDQSSTLLTLSNYPDPFRGVTTISFNLPEKAMTSLQLYNLQGQLVKDIARGMMNSGPHRLSLHTPELVPGLYMLKLTSGQETKLRKVMLSR